MTRSAFAAAPMPGTSLADTAGTEYQPGVCNIGPAEIARRRRAGHVGLVATLVVLAVLVAIGAPPLARLIIALPAAGAASGYLQARLKFCAGFGSRGVFNFGQLGQTQPVVDADARGARPREGQPDRFGEPRDRCRRRRRGSSPSAVTTVGSDTATDSAAADRVERVAAALRSHNIEAIVVDTGQEAREIVLGLIPDGAEVHSGKSKTLEDVGLYSELVESGRYDAIRPRIFAMDRETQGREIRKLAAAPDFMLGSVAAITEDGTLVAASATGSQLGPYAAGAGRRDPRRRQPEDRGRSRRCPATDPRRRLPVRERPGPSAHGRRHRAREGPRHLRRMAGRSNHRRSSASRSGSEAGRTTDANLLLWIGQVLLVLAFLGAGCSHTVGFERSSTRPVMDWMAAVGRDRMRLAPRGN